ncbi:DUF3833 family protein [Palleronia sp. LCG004]|uniref:DUF3833 family protein n=1 Tax=Palleronia sp. LCG004 TaxID=3079304 RepID=UPI002942719B|nr:DUF3833 family protein [Palleronia sp. LCG004]WOI55431.1 DUF3833 family protein [Palleronia sp. LCG004]
MDIFIYISVFAVVIIGLIALRNRLLSFKGQSARDYEGLGPSFDPREHLNGRLICDGVIFGPTGRVTSRFRALMEGEWDGDHGVLHEEFAYDSGTKQTRAWHLILGDDGRFVADAEDIVGRGAGEISGPAVRLRYRIILPYEAGGHKLDVVDWMYLCESGTIINRSQFTKFGVRVAELVATIRPESPG